MATNPNKAFFTGTDQILNWYDINAKKPYWSVTDAKNKILFQYSGTDETESRSLLEENVRAAERAGVNSILCLRIHPRVPKDGYFVSSSPEMIVTYFRPTEYDSATYYPAQSVGYMAQNSSNLESKINALESKIAALTMQLETEDFSEDDDDEPAEENFLSGLMKNPQIQALLMNSLNNLISPKVTVKHMAGVKHEAEEISIEDQINTALEILSKHDDQLGSDLMLLAELAETDPNQFNFLLKMLRK